MQPSTYVVLDELPLTRNGKVDRAALPEPEGEAQREYAAPRTPQEAILCALFEQALGVERIGVDDDFFAHGGHSLLAMRLIGAIRATLGVDLSLRSLFETPTVAGLAAQLAPAASDQPKLQALSRELPLPISFAQQRLWFLDQLQPGASVYNVPSAMRISGAPDVERLRRSIAALAQRHEVLRTRFELRDGEPVQVIAPEPDVELPVIDVWSGEVLERLLHEEARRPFDLQHGPLVRALLLRADDTEYVLLLTLHHSIADGWSAAVLWKDLGALYEGKALPPLPVQYADFAAWQRARLRGGVLEEQLQYWKDALAAMPGTLELPADRPRPAVQSFDGTTCDVRFDAGTVDALRRLSRAEGTTLFMTLLAAFEVLLARYTGQEDFGIGVPVANRDRAELDGLIGFFVNTLVMRADLRGHPTFRDVLRRVRERSLGAYAHQELPFEKLVEELQPERALSHTPLFQVMFDLQQAAGDRSFGGLRLERWLLPTTTTKCDLALIAGERDDALSVRAVYSTALFDHDTIERLLGHFGVLLRQAAEDPARSIWSLGLLTDDERERFAELNRTAREGAAASIVALVEANASARPTSIAVVSAERTYTYEELNARANQIAAWLRKRGVGAESLVGVQMERSADGIAALRGVLKAGAAYVPLDVNLPANRLQYIVEDAGVEHVITHIDAEVDAESTANPALPIDAAQLAYVLYTSGSTGRPKGVAIAHGALANLVAWHCRRYALTADDRATQFAAAGFDASVWEIWSTLAAGASLHIVGEELRLSPAELPQWLQRERITVSFLPTPVAEAVLALEWPRDLALRYLLTGGDRLHPLPSQSYPFAVSNCYGPTENAVVATEAEIAPGIESMPPIGRPIDNVRAYVLDANLQPVPFGVAGELYLGGDGLARGYAHRADLTAERFIPAENGERLYRTGDVVRWRADGNLMYLGRGDDQVKIRGFRIELGEIEAVLNEHEAVAEAVVVAIEPRVNEKQLVAYVVPSAPVTAAALRQHLAQTLPEYMVPPAIVMMEALPLTSSGKVDRAALPAPQSVERAHAFPRTQREEVLCALFEETLGVDNVGVDDNFFELGGHSLLAMRLIGRVRGAFGGDVTIRSLFEAPTVAGLARLLDGESSAMPPLVPASRDAELPLSYGQQRLWFLEQLRPGEAAYNVPLPLRLRGALDAARLHRALTQLAQRHEILRSRFETRDGAPVLRIDAAADIALPVIDLGARDLRQFLHDAARTPFALDRALLRASLIRVAGDDHVLLLELHHSIADGWSTSILWSELAALYEERPLAALPIQFADYAAWQRQCLESGALDGQLQYWKETLRGMPEVLELPADRARPAVQRFDGAVRDRKGTR